MTEEQLRQIVRETIARHLGREPLPAAHAPASHFDGGPRSVVPGAVPAWKAHASHFRLALPAGRDQDGPCLVEPDVKCTHCAFCQSYGH
jgi:hypothetical protein